MFRLEAVATAMSARYYALVAGGLPGIAGLAHLYRDDSVCEISLSPFHRRQGKPDGCDCQAAKCSEQLSGASDLKASKAGWQSVASCLKVDLGFALHM